MLVGGAGRRSAPSVARCGWAGGERKDRALKSHLMRLRGSKSGPARVDATNHGLWHPGPRIPHSSTPNGRRDQPGPRWLIFGDQGVSHNGQYRSPDEVRVRMIVPHLGQKTGGRTTGRGRTSPADMFTISDQSARTAAATRRTDSTLNTNCPPRRCSSGSSSPSCFQRRSVPSAIPNSRASSA